MEYEYIEDFGYVSKEKLQEYQTILDIQMNEIRDCFLGRESTKAIENQLQLEVDKLYGNDIFKVTKRGAWSFDIELVNRPKLLQIMVEMDTNE